jgi:carnitine O-acetyltransferase
MTFFMQDAHRATLFRRAVARHLQYAAWAADAQGVDRHLFGLKRLLKEGEPVPLVYKDESFSKTNHWELSTSQLSSPWLDGWGYGEGKPCLTEKVVLPANISRASTVVPDGYGLSYSIGHDYIRWTITSLKRKTAELHHYLAEAATQVRDMMERAAKEESQKAGEDAVPKAKL